MILPAKLLRTALLTTALAAVCTIGASAASLGVGTDAQAGGGSAYGADGGQGGGEQRGAQQLGRQYHRLVPPFKG